MSETRRINERYHLEKKVSAKETVSVYRATDTLSSEIVAVKLIDADDLEDRRERFQEYARILQSIHHPALPRLLDSGLTAAGSAFLVTEFLQGASLDHLAGEPAVRTLGLLLFAVDGLEALAQAGLAHGNLRADNLFVVDVSGGEEVKLLGLGSGVLREATEATHDFRNDLRDFASLAAEVLGATMISANGRSRVELPAEALGGLRDPEALRAFLEDVLGHDPTASEAERLASWSGVRQELRRALVGGVGRTAEIRRADVLPGSGTVRVSLKQLRRQMEEQESEPAEELKTRLFRPEDLAPAAPAEPPPVQPRKDGTVRMDFRAAAERLREPPAPPPAPATPAPPPDSSAAPAKPSPVSGTVRLDLRPSQPPSEPTPPVPPPAVAPSAPPPPLPPPAPLPVAAPPPALTPPPPPVSPPVFTPPPPPPAPAAAAPPPPAAKPSPPRQTAPAARTTSAARPGQPKALILVAGAVLGFLVLATGGGFLVWKLRRPPAPPPAPAPVVVPKPVPVPATPTPAPTPQVNPQILLAEGFVAANDLARAQEAIAAIPANQTLSADEQERVQRVMDAVKAQQTQQTQQEAGGLAKALASGDARALRSAVEAIRPEQEATLTRPAKKDLARARKVLDLDAKLARTEREGHPLEIVRQASALLAEQAKNARALKARDDAAAVIESEAEAKVQAGQLDAAATHLEQLREAWPNRHGLAERIEHLRTEDRTNHEMDDLLASAARAGQAGKPLDGLRILSGARPPAHYADRFREAKARLEAQFAQLDQRPPDIRLRKEADKLAYDKNATVVVPLRITDDYGVETTTGWARPEGGQYTQIELRKVSATDYEMEIPAALHDNKTIELYVLATDRSGHKSQLGSAGSPIRIKKKGFFSKILGKNG